jgi:LysR family glycine cleavage system transcriptional activator
VFLEDIFPVCSPKLLPQGPAPADPRAIRGHTLIHSSHRLGDWPRWLKAAGLGEREIDPSRGLVFDLTTMALDAAEAGLGIAITRQAQVAAALEAGTLIAPFRRDLLSGEGCYLLTRPERADDPGVQAFRRWLMEEARACAAEWRRGRGGSALAGPEARAARPRSQRPGQRPGVA